jgi:hypothetical protein
LIRRPRLLAVGLVLTAVFAAAAAAQAASLSLDWNAPTTNANGTPLTDLADYRIYVATSNPTCPGGSFHTLPSPTASPAA